MLKCNLFLWSKLYFQHHYSSLQCHMIFRNHNNMLICCSRNISDYYQCWKQLCCWIWRKLIHLILWGYQTVYLGRWDEACCTWIRPAAGFLRFSKCFCRCCSWTFKANPEPRIPCGVWKETLLMMIGPSSSRNWAVSSIILHYNGVSRH